MRLYLQTVSLIIIALTLIFRDFGPDKPLKKDTQETTTKYVEVLKRVTIDLGLSEGKVGFLVKDGDKLDFVPYDKGSRFDVMEMPKILRVISVEGQNKAYSISMLHEVKDTESN